MLRRNKHLKDNQYKITIMTIIKFLIIFLTFNMGFSHDCGILLPIHPSECPPNTYSPTNPFFLANCDEVAIGELCEGDGECGTNHFFKQLSVWYF